MKTIEELFEVFDDLTPWDKVKVYNMIADRIEIDSTDVLDTIPEIDIVDYVKGQNLFEDELQGEYDRGFDEGWLAAEKENKEE